MAQAGVEGPPTVKVVVPGDRVVSAVLAALVAALVKGQQVGAAIGQLLKIVPLVRQPELRR